MSSNSQASRSSKDKDSNDNRRLERKDPFTDIKPGGNTSRHEKRNIEDDVKTIISEKLQCVLDMEDSDSVNSKQSK